MFPGLLDNSPDEIFLGIGTILNTNLLQAKRSIVMGSGYGYGAPPEKAQIDTWSIYCIRGKMTASLLGVPAELVATDPAILIHDLYNGSEVPTYDFAFMPHWSNMDDFCGHCGPWRSMAIAKEFTELKRSAKRYLSEDRVFSAQSERSKTRSSSSSRIAPHPKTRNIDRCYFELVPKNAMATPFLAPQAPFSIFWLTPAVVANTPQYSEASLPPCRGSTVRGMSRKGNCQDKACSESFR